MIDSVNTRPNRSSRTPVNNGLGLTNLNTSFSFSQFFLTALLLISHELDVKLTACHDCCTKSSRPILHQPAHGTLSLGEIPSSLCRKKQAEFEMELVHRVGAVGSKRRLIADHGKGIPVCGGCSLSDEV